MVACSSTAKAVNMKRTALAAIFALVSFEASALVRYMVQNMTCAEVQEAVERDGAAILYRQATASGIPLYDRYVRSEEFCEGGETASRASVPTADTQSCRVSKCVDASRFGD
jgi:hypothetical protein